jgi:hypothetical protein
MSSTLTEMEIVSPTAKVESRFTIFIVGVLPGKRKHPENSSNVVSNSDIIDFLIVVFLI